MRLVLLSTLLLVGAGAARAEDFTGFYAGINAGYARGHERDRILGESPSAPAKPGVDLPPSARDAALSLRPSGTGRAASPPGR